jgi:hypothetical protein
MAVTLEVRQEIHSLIDTIPERNLYVLRPLLDFLVDNRADDVLSEDEQGLLEKCRLDRQEHPESFTPWAKVRKNPAGA